MTELKQRLAIAEICGWKQVPRRPLRCGFKFQDRHAFEKDGIYYGGLNSIPEYLSDLNAIHKAEKFITDGMIRRIYYQTLYEITGDQWNTIVATAAQRAEAFLRALGAWRENNEK